MPNNEPDHAAKKPGGTGKSKQPSKEERLAEALRANLRRRKGASKSAQTDKDEE